MSATDLTFARGDEQTIDMTKVSEYRKSLMEQVI